MSAAEKIESLYHAVSPAYRLQSSGVRIDGGQPIDFKSYPFIPAMVDTYAPRITIIKAAQLGWTIACILRALEDAKRGVLRNGRSKLRGILYGFPSDREVQDFAKARFGPLMSQNPQVFGRHEGQTDSAGLKQFGNSWIYFRGIGQKGASATKSLSQIKSIPIDHIYLDERDEMDDARVDAVEHRLDGSPCPEITSLSTPTLPEYGVDMLYKTSNQSSWLWRCDRCNEWTCLEDGYPDCIAEPRNKEPYYLCSGCRKPLERTFGEWVARRSDVTDHLGYWVSQLCSPTKTALDIIQAADLSIQNGRMREFYNQTLARAYADVDEQISEEQLNALVRDDMEKPLRHEGPCAMGVDPGKPHWYEVRARVSDTDSIQVARGRADSYEELSRIARAYHVESGVMDQGYDPSAVAKFVDDHPGWYGCLYVGQKKSDADWIHKDKIVKVGRTRLLDDAHNEILSKRITFYRRDEFWHDHFVPQMTNLKRATLENDRTGMREAVWVITGGQKNDHLRHANAYAHLAQQRVGLAESVSRAQRKATSMGRRVARPRSAMVL